jgi:hypothetical protein
MEKAGMHQVGIEASSLEIGSKVYDKRLYEYNREDRL